jgi:hypothetical protein
LSQPEQWLYLANEDCARAAFDLWRNLFAPWMLTRQSEAEAVADDAMCREVARITIDHHTSREREATDLRRWLCSRSDDICGPFMPRTDDLFGDTAPGPDWKTLSRPLDRLASFVADGSNPPAQRREANSAVELFQRRVQEHVARATLSPPFLRPIGMLMLVPAAVGA